MPAHSACLVVILLLHAAPAADIAGQRTWTVPQRWSQSIREITRENELTSKAQKLNGFKSSFYFYLFIFLREGGFEGQMEGKGVGK